MKRDALFGTSIVIKVDLGYEKDISQALNTGIILQYQTARA